MYLATMLFLLYLDGLQARFPLLPTVKVTFDERSPKLSAKVLYKDFTNKCSNEMDSIKNYFNSLSFKPITEYFKSTHQKLLLLPLPIKYLAVVQIFIWLMLRLYPEKLPHFSLNDISNHWYTWITSSFSHVSLSHLVGNLTAFLIFGPTTCNLLGAANFLKFIGLSSVFVSFCSKLLSRFRLCFSRTAEMPESRYSLGFSGNFYITVDYINQ